MELDAVYCRPIAELLLRNFLANKPLLSDAWLYRGARHPDLGLDELLQPSR